MRLRTHPKVLVPAIVWFLVLSAAAVIGWWVVPNDQDALAYGALGLWALLTLVCVVPSFFNWATTTYTITADEVRASTGLIWTKNRAMRLDRIVSVDVERGLLDRIFGCGTLRLSDASSPSAFLLVDVPRVAEVEDALHRRTR